MKYSSRNANPLATRATDAYDPLENGQFLNPHGQPRVPPKAGCLAVEPPKNRGKRYLESPLSGGIAKMGKA